LRPDVVVSNTTKGHFIAAASTLGTGIPLVCYVRDGVTTDFLSRIGVLATRVLLRTAPSGIIANSRFTMTTVPRARRQRSRAIVPSPIVEPGHRTTGDRQEGPFRCGIVGRLAEWKGQHVAIEAFARAFPNDDDAELEILGDALFGEDAYRERLAALVDGLGVANRVHFRGHVSDVYDHMRRWDCLIHASVIPEPFGQVVVQGMAAGLPVVAAAAGGPLETVDDGATGYLYPPGDIDALAARLHRIRTRPAEARTVGAAAAAEATRYFQPAVADEIERVLRRVARPVSRRAISRATSRA